MDKKNMHGRVFKKLREERGYKSKDVAGDVISTRTLTRFEADETSLPILTFEKLLENCGISYLDYMEYYVDNTQTEYNEFIKRMDNYLQSGFSSKLVNECKKELKKKDINFSRRLDILSLINAVSWKEDKDLFEENKRIVREKIELSSKLSWIEMSGIYNLISFASKKDYSVEYIDRVIEDCSQTISTTNLFSRYLSVIYCDVLLASLAFLSRNSYYKLAEKRCKDTLKLFNELPILLNKALYSRDGVGILSKVYLRQNKKEGAELANICLEYDNIVVEITDSPIHKYIRDNTYETSCKLNKTGIDIEF